mgnify:FL=1
MIVGAIGATMAIWPDLWLRIFLDADAAGPLAAGRAYFHTVGPFYGFFALGLALYFASQGAGRMGWPIVASLCRMAAAFGGALLLTAVYGFGVEGVFIAVAAGMFLYGSITVLAIRATRWR